MAINMTIERVLRSIDTKSRNIDAITDNRYIKLKRSLI